MKKMNILLAVTRTAGPPDVKVAARTAGTQAIEIIFDKHVHHSN